MSSSCKREVLVLVFPSNDLRLLAGIAVGIANRVGLSKLSIQGNNLFCGVTDVGLKSIGRGYPTSRELSSWNMSSVCDEGLFEISHDCQLAEKIDLF
ncbi:hypothetical protein KY290_008067 [Solanum tuberosum]|uniref:Uncharacterized protein n=1 Tax=Solanum tuberosum TaxID=4113 RepID=A0ABQ7W8Q7_SOLTU|nr:hypothetical protein KY290_008067 [Solanum tuberosum]